MTTSPSARNRRGSARSYGRLTADTTDTDRRQKDRGGFRFVPTVSATGAAVPIELPAELREFTNVMQQSDRLSLGWASYALAGVTR